MKKNKPQDHVKLALRHLRKLNQEQLDEIKKWLSSREIMLKVLHYANNKLLASFSRIKKFPDFREGKTVTFKKDISL
ncbi:MAG: hypothetical protein ABIJ26_01430 [Candidatus Margulisiibacteriota bacterium]